MTVTKAQIKLRQMILDEWRAKRTTLQALKNIQDKMGKTATTSTQIGYWYKRFDKGDTKIVPESASKKLQKPSDNPKIVENVKAKDIEILQENDSHLDGELCAKTEAMISNNRFVTILGPEGSGRTSLVINACKTLQKSATFVYVNDQLDSNGLFGSYKTSGIPGDFTWEETSFSKTIQEPNSLIVLKGFESATSDLIVSILQLTKEGTHPLPSARNIQMNESARIVAIVTQTKEFTLPKNIIEYPFAITTSKYETEQITVEDEDEIVNSAILYALVKVGTEDVGRKAVIGIGMLEDCKPVSRLTKYRFDNKELFKNHRIDMVEICQIDASNCDPTFLRYSMYVFCLETVLHEFKCDFNDEFFTHSYIDKSGTFVNKWADDLIKEFPHIRDQALKFLDKALVENKTLVKGKNPLSPTDFEYYAYLTVQRKFDINFVCNVLRRIECFVLIEKSNLPKIHCQLCGEKQGRDGDLKHSHLGLNRCIVLKSQKFLLEKSAEHEDFFPSSPVECIQILKYLPIGKDRSELESRMLTQTAVHPHLLDSVVRDHLNVVAPRTMTVVEPLKLTIENFEEFADIETIEAEDFPGIPSTTKHKIAFDRVVYIEADDYRETAGKDFRRLTNDQSVGLKYVGLVLNVTGKDEDGLKVRAEKLENTKKPKAFIHWVAKPLTVEIRMYEPLFKHANPEDKTTDLSDVSSEINENTLKVYKDSKCDAYVFNKFGNVNNFQFERVGYFAFDPDSTKEKLVFNRTVSLREDDE